MSLIERNPAAIVRIWFLAVIMIYATISFIGIERGASARHAAEKLHDDRIAADRFEAEKTRPVVDEKKLAQLDPVKVKTGIYIERIIELSLPDASWMVDFYIWFHWSDGQVNPGKNFQVVDGEIIEKPELVKQSQQGDIHYQLYRVKAKMTKFFNTSRFPRDDHLLTIKIEDRENHIYSLRYEPDTENTAYSSRVRLHGYEIYKDRLVAKPHSYKTSRGDSSSAVQQQDTFSQLIYGIWIKRPGWGNYTKMFEGLFAAVAVGMLSFFIRTTTTNRISLGVGSFFASVAANYVASRNLPNIGILTLTDVITGLAMMTIFLVIWHTIIATRLYELHKDERMVHRFDMYGFAIFLTGFVVSNLALAISASI